MPGLGRPLRDGAQPVFLRWMSGDGPDLTVHCLPNCTVQHLILQLRARQHVPGAQQCRLYCGGRRLQQEEVVPVGMPLHIMTCSPVAPLPHSSPTLSDGEHSPLASQPHLSGISPTEACPVWDEGLDPAQLLLWVVGVLLALSWLALLFRRQCLSMLPNVSE